MASSDLLQITFWHILITKSSPMNSHINSVQNSTISEGYCVPTIKESVTYDNY